jgi:hypothetical protein
VKSKNIIHYPIISTATLRAKEEGNNNIYDSLSSKRHIGPAKPKLKQQNSEKCPN